MRLLRSYAADKRRPEKGGQPWSVSSNAVPASTSTKTPSPPAWAPGEAGQRAQEIRTFGTTTRQLLVLPDWLAEMGVEVVGMESTGVYWKPIYYLLEEVVEC